MSANKLKCKYVQVVKYGTLATQKTHQVVYYKNFVHVSSNPVLLTTFTLISIWKKQRQRADNNVIVIKSLFLHFVYRIQTYAYNSHYCTWTTARSIIKFYNHIVDLTIFFLMLQLH